jgi:predicted ribosomally synthesized peptide with nif11-like leader
MAKQSVAKFFASVYSDKALQGALHYALAKASPDVVVDIAKKKGFDFTPADLTAALGGTGELSEAELSGATGGAIQFQATQLSHVALQTSFWKGFGGVMDGDGFGLTIPGPSFVSVMTTEMRDASEVAGAEAPTGSAVDLYQDLIAE